MVLSMSSIITWIKQHTFTFTFKKLIIISVKAVDDVDVAELKPNLQRWSASSFVMCVRITYVEYLLLQYSNNRYLPTTLNDKKIKN